MKKLWFTIALIGVFGFSTSVFATPNALTGEWKLMTLNGETVTISVPVTLNFPSDEGMVRGFGGCNGYDAFYYVTGENEIHFGSIASSLEDCGDISDVEHAYFEALAVSTVWDIDGSLLTFQDNGGTQLLQFSNVESLQVEEPSAPLSVALKDVTMVSETTLLIVTFMIIGLSTITVNKKYRD